MAKRPRTRAQLRADAERIKKRVAGFNEFTWNSWPAEPLPDPDPRRIGMVARTHKECACDMCQRSRHDRSQQKRADRWERDQSG